MPNCNLNFNKIDDVIKNTIEVVTANKSEIFDITENARRQCKRLEFEYEEAVEKLNIEKQDAKNLEIEITKNKKTLLLVNKDFTKYSEKEKQAAYEKTELNILKLTVKRQDIRYLTERKNELEVSLNEAIKAVNRAEKMLGNMTLSLVYLNGNLIEISSKIHGLQQKYQVGLKIIRAQEEERQRVAKEIFDGPVKQLSQAIDNTNTCVDLFCVNGSNENNITQAKTQMIEIKKAVRNSLSDVRKIIYNLRPMSLDDLGLVPTLQRYSEKFKEETGINVILSTNISSNSYNATMSLTIFRIVQEALENIKKHSKASEANIVAEQITDKLNVLITDNGIGFDVDESKKRHCDIDSGSGLLGINERLELLEGNMTITSVIGKGTRLFITIPIIFNH